MTRFALVVAALLLTILGGNAAAADKREHTSKNARKLLATLDSVGINNKELQKFIAEADTHFHRGYLYIAETESVGGKTIGGKLSLRYKFGPKKNTKRLELHYAPENSHFEMTACTDSINLRYRLEF